MYSLLSLILMRNAFKALIKLQTYITYLEEPLIGDALESAYDATIKQTQSA